MSATPPPQPPGPPPGPPPAVPPRAQSRSLSWKVLAIPAIAIAVILAVVVAAVALSGGDEASAQDVSLEGVSTSGNNPFAPSVGTDETDVSPPPNSGGSYSGDLVGLYGGTLNISSCDPQKLVTFLKQNPDKGNAWASTLGITFAQIPDYVAGLTPVILRSDTYVTNYGYSNGRAIPIPAVLQAGTAVLVDKYGVPVTKCYCGNPLTKPPSYSKPTYTGTPWTKFSPGGITIINKSTTIIDIFVLVDPKTGDPFTRPPGSTGGSDTPGTGKKTAPSSTTTTLAPATAPPTPPPTEPPTAPPGPSPEEQAIARVQQASQACYPFPAPIEDSTGASTSTTPAGSYFVLQVVTDTTSGGHQTFTWHVDYATLAFSPQDSLAQVASNHCSLLN